MAWAIFTEPFNYDRRPLQAMAFSVRPDASPQQWPRDVIDAAVKAGKAKEVSAPRKRKSGTQNQQPPCGIF